VFLKFTISEGFAQSETLTCLKPLSLFHPHILLFVNQTAAKDHL